MLYCGLLQTLYFDRKLWRVCFHFVVVVLVISTAYMMQVWKMDVSEVAISLVLRSIEWVFRKGLKLSQWFLGKARDELLRLSRLSQFYSDLLAKALLLVNPTELEIFYSDLLAKVLLLVNPTELEIFYQNILAKALLLVNPTELEIF